MNFSNLKAEKYMGGYSPPPSIPIYWAPAVDMGAENILHWPDLPVDWWLYDWTAEYGVLTKYETQAAVDLAFDEWASVGTTEFEHNFVDYTTRTWDDDNYNVLYWAEDGDPAHNPGGPLGTPEISAVTIFIYNSSYEFLDVDIVFDGRDYDWSDDGTGNRDIQAVATHEIGHMLGLHHTPVAGATMHVPNPQASDPDDLSWRTIEDDDEVGVSFLYGGNLIDDESFSGNNYFRWDITVPDSKELYINSNATIEMDGQINVYGYIDAYEAVFESLSGDEFDGIHIYNDAGIYYCTFQNAYRGIKTYNCGTVEILDNTFEDCTWGVSLSNGGNFVDVCDNVFDNVHYSIDVTATPAWIDGNYIYNTGGHRGLGLSSITSMYSIDNNSILGNGNLFRGVQIIVNSTSNACVEESTIQGCSESCVFNYSNCQGVISPDNTLTRNGSYSIKNLNSGYTLDARNNTWYYMSNYGPVNTDGGTFLPKSVVTDSDAEILFDEAERLFLENRREEAMQKFKSLIVMYSNSDYSVKALNYISFYFENVDQNIVTNNNHKYNRASEANKEKCDKLHREAIGFFKDIQNQIHDKDNVERISDIINLEILYWTERSHQQQETELVYDELIRTASSDELRQGLQFRKAIYYIYGEDDTEKAIPLLLELADSHSELAIDAKEELYYLEYLPKPERLVAKQQDSEGMDDHSIQNYPNPFNPSTNIIYHLANAGHVKVTIYDTMGREVKVLVNQNQNTGKHSVLWNGTNQSGNKISSGIYLYEIKTADMTIKNKMLLVR